MKLFRLLLYATGLFIGMTVALYQQCQFPPRAPKNFQPVSKTKTTPQLIDHQTVSPLSAELALGKTIFKNKCAMCHNRNMRDDLTGPALAGVRDRWKGYPEQDLFNWIRNSQKMIKEEHPKALEVWQEWEPNIMIGFPNMTDEEISAVLAYIDHTAKV